MPSAALRNLKISSIWYSNVGEGGGGEREGSEANLKSTAFLQGTRGKLSLATFVDNQLVSHLIFGVYPPNVSLGT